MEGAGDSHETSEGDQAIRAPGHAGTADRNMASEADITTARDAALREARMRNLSREDAEDIAQVVAERLLRQPRVPDNVAAWSRKVARNAIIDLSRQRKRPDEKGAWVAREFTAHEDLEVLQTVTGFLGMQRPTSAAAMQHKAREEMMELLAEVLDPREIDMLLLVSRGKSQAEIAEALGYKNADTVKATLVRVRRKAEGLREKLAEFASHPRPY